MSVIVQLSDCHLKATPGDTAASPDAALDRAVTAGLRVAGRADLVLLTGDLSDDGSVAALERVRAAAGRFGCPMLAVAGNHDLPATVAEVFGTPRSVQLGGWRIVPFTTWVKGSDGGRLDPGTALRVIDELASTDGATPRPTLLVLHHPPISPSTNPIFTLEGAGGLVAGLRLRPHVRAAATGHLHEFFTAADEGFEVGGAPSTWYALQHDGPEYRLADPQVIGGCRWDLHPDGSFERTLFEG